MDPRQIIIYSWISLWHIFYADKVFLLALKIQEANKLKIVPFLVGLFIMILGESGGMLVNLILGKPLGLFIPEFKMHAIILIWIIVNYFPFKQTFHKFVKNPALELILKSLNQMRKALALCAQISTGITLLNDSRSQVKAICAPVVMSVISSCTAGIVTSIAINFLLNPEKKLKNELIEPSWYVFYTFPEMICRKNIWIPIICAICFFIAKLNAQDLEFVVVVIFVSLSVHDTYQKILKKHKTE